MVATIETPGGITPIANTYTFATDSLGSAGVITDSSGVPVEVQDYKTFGGQGLNDKSATYDSQRKYIGEMSDAETGLNYLNARYYNASVGGGVISEDPQLWGNQNLQDPQSLNSYSYAGNNPILLSDPSGQFSIQQAGMFALGFGNAYFSDNLGGFRRGSASDSYYSAGQSYGDKTAMAQGVAEIYGALSAGILSDIGGLVLATPSGGLSLAGAVGINGLAVGVAGHGGSVSAIAGYNLSKAKGTGGNGNNWGDPTSLQDHFDRHGADFGAKNPNDYANKANEFITEKKYTNVFKEGKDTVYWNKDNNITVYTNKEGNVTSGYKVTNENKINTYKARAAKQ